MATTVHFGLVSILLQLTFIFGTDVQKLLEQKATAEQFKANGGADETKTATNPPVTAETFIKSLPGGISILLGKDVMKIKEFYTNGVKYYDENTGEELKTDPFHSVESGKFIVADCGTRVFQVEGNIDDVTVTPAATESAPTPGPIVLQLEEKTLQEKEGKYVDKATGTTIVSPFSRLSMARVTTSGKGKQMHVESTPPVDNPACPTQEQRNSYYQKISVRMSEKK